MTGAMRSLGELGIGLSVVFCVFVLALVAELCYIFYWKRRKLAKSTFAHDRLKINGVNICKGKQPLHSSSPDFVHEASLVGSFGGYPSSGLPEVGSGVDPSFGDQSLLGQYSSSQYPPSHLLFSIKEETKEDMELAYSGLGSTMKPNSRLRSRTPSDVLAIHFTSGSSSPAASLDTPLITPTSSPPPVPMPKLSPFAACAVRPTSSCGKSSSPIAEIHILSGYQGSSSPVINGPGRTSLRLLFERSPLWHRTYWPPSPGAHLPNVLLQGLPAGATEVFEVSRPPNCPRLSLGALFQQSSSFTPCSFTCQSPPESY